MKNTFIAIALLTFMFGYQNSNAQSSKNNKKQKIDNKMTLEQNKLIVIKFNNEFFEKGNTEIAKELFAETFINHSAPPNSPTDTSPMIKFVLGLHHGFSNISVQILDIFGEGDKVCVRKTITATHTGEFMGKPASGKKIVINIIDIEVLKNGKITDRWNSTDFPQVFQSL